jgi:hypothetical protein
VVAEKPESRHKINLLLMKKNFYLSLFGGLALIAIFNSCSKEDDKVYGSMEGTIINSQTGIGLENARVSLTGDVTVTNGDDAEISVYTDAFGGFVFDKVEVGTYRMIVESDGYFARIINDVEVVEGLNYAPQQTIVEAPETGSFRIVLIWGESPYDLDSHLTGPSSDGSGFHVYYSYKYNNDLTVDLDVDDLVSYGPETITIHSFLSGTYRYSVHNYSDQTSTGSQGIYASPSRVEVYDASGLLEAFDAPAASVAGNTWRVFEIVVSGTSATIVPVNEYVTAATSSDIESFKNAGTKPAMDITGF